MHLCLPFPLSFICVYSNSSNGDIPIDDCLNMYMLDYQVKWSPELLVLKLLIVLAVLLVLAY